MAVAHLRGARRRQKADEQALVLLHLAIQSLPAGAKARHHLVERFAELAVLVVRVDLDRDVEGSLAHLLGRPHQRGDRARQELRQATAPSRWRRSERPTPQASTRRRVGSQRGHRLGLVHLRDDTPPQRVEIDRPVRHQSRNTPVVVDVHDAGLASKRRLGGVVRPAGRS